MKNIKDLKKLYHFLSKYSLQPKVKVVFFEDVSTRKINQLFGFFDNLQKAETAITEFARNEFTSVLLQSII